VVTLMKAWLFGLIAAMVACYKGMTCEQSPVGVGRAVNQATVIALMLVFALNYVITTIYVIAYPPKV
jgi:phospholipid/cholesterol/gamma-HCH transport system permease protein